MAIRVSLLFAVTTNPQSLTDASAHSGGWSESHWTVPNSQLNSFYIPQLAQRRSALLPNQCSVIGFRTQTFTITGNRLLPGGTTSGRFLYPGGMGTDLNIPQDALQCSATAIGSPNATRFNLRGLPDSQISNGEYQPSAAFKNAMSVFLNGLVAAGWGFVGRDKTRPSARVLSVVGNLVTLSANVGGVANTDFLRMNRVYDSLGNPVKGSYLITNVAGSVYTLAGMAGHTVINPSGTARVDAINQFLYQTCLPGRAVSRKIGRPFEQYRGRTSHSRP